MYHFKLVQPFAQAVFFDTFDFKSEFFIERSRMLRRIDTYAIFWIKFGALLQPCMG